MKTCVQLGIIVLGRHKLMVCLKSAIVRELHTISLDCNKFMVCFKFLLCAIALLPLKFHAACYLSELDTTALHFKIISH